MAFVPDFLANAVSRSTAAAEEAETEEEEDAGWAVCGALVSGVCSLSRRVTRRQLPYALGERSHTAPSALQIHKI